MFLSKLVAVWLLFSCVAAVLLGLAMKLAGRDDEMRRMDHEHVDERGNVSHRPPSTREEPLSVHDAGESSDALLQGDKK